MNLKCIDYYHATRKKCVSRLEGKTVADIFWFLLSWITDRLYFKWQPLFMRRLTSPLYGHIHDFVSEAATYAQGKRILDAGAGSKPYRNLFVGAQYESTDIGGEHTFLCALDAIPKEDNTYDVVLCSEVLEHCPRPYEVVGELSRILRPSGRLYLTVPLQARNHGCPHHYFNYAESGLRLLLQKAGFTVLRISPAGGAFHFLANNIALIPMELFQQAKARHAYLESVAWALSLALVQPFLIVINILLYGLDGLDRQKAITSNYLCVCEKPCAEPAADKS